MSAEKDSFARFLKHFAKGTVLFNEGDEGEEMYIIRSGKVAIKKRVAHGEIVVAVLEKGDFFGEMAMLEHIPRTAGAEMVSRPAVPQQAEAIAYFISKASGNVFPVFRGESLIGRYDSVTGQAPEVDLTNEDSARNISRRHARFVMKDGKPYVAEEIGTMNGTFLNNQKIPTGVLTPTKDGDEFTLCRLARTFRLPSPK